MVRPLAELGFDGVDHSFQLVEVAVVQAEAPCKLPNSFDGIQVRRVGRQIAQRKVEDMFFSPWPVEKGMMVFGVIGDHHYPATGSDAVAAQAFHECEKGRAIELTCFAAKQKLPISQPHRTKISDAASRGSMQQDRVLSFRRNPHLAS